MSYKIKVIYSNGDSHIIDHIFTSLKEIKKWFSHDYGISYIWLNDTECVNGLGCRYFINKI